MKVLLITFLATTIAQNQASHIIPVGVTIGLSPHSHPVSSLYHAQDIHGQYAYGYSTPTSTKSETKTADGITRGGYSYIDSNGLLQTVQYVADPIHGFRVAATNLPQDLPHVAHAKAEHLAQFTNIAAQRTVHYSNPVAVPISSVPHLDLVQLPQPVQDLPEVALAKAQHLATLQAAYNNPGVIPQTVQDLPEVVKARAEHLAIVEQTKARDAAINLSPVHLIGNVVPIHTAQIKRVEYAPAATAQYHAQDGWGQYSYGYIGPLSAKSETKSADGVTRGGYSYIDANGVLQTVNYVADDVHGFRVAATNLPVAAKTHVLAPPAPVVLQKEANSGLYTQEIVY